MAVRREVFARPLAVAPYGLLLCEEEQEALSFRRLIPERSRYRIESEALKELGVCEARAVAVARVVTCCCRLILSALLGQCLCAEAVRAFEDERARLLELSPGDDVLPARPVLLGRQRPGAPHSPARLAQPPGEDPAACR